MIRNYKYRLYPSKAQIKRLEFALDLTRTVYNMTLEERIISYSENGESLSYTRQSYWIKHYRRCIPGASDFPWEMYAQAMKDLDQAYQAFFRRIKQGTEAPGFPKFKARHRWNSFGYVKKVGFKVEEKVLKLNGIGRVRAKWHRPVPEIIKTARIKREVGDKWFVIFACDLEDATPLLPVERQIGLDLGINKTIMTSNGDIIDTPNFFRESQRELRRLQRSQARKYKQGKKRFQQSENWHRDKRRVQRHHWHIANQRKWVIENVVCDLIEQYDFIAVEDLRIRNMVRNRKLSKSIYDKSWGYFLQKLEEKAEALGRIVIRVDPAYTSRTCSKCGYVYDNLTLKDRWLDCPECGLSIDRDHNAAINILKRGREDWRQRS